MPINIPRDCEKKPSKTAPPTAKRAFPSNGNNAYSFLWTGSEIRLHQQKRSEKLTHAASNRFTERGLRPGDALYIWGVMSGKLYLLGRMVVGQVASFDRACRFLPLPPGAAAYSEHALAKDPAPKRFDNVIPSEKVSQLRFISPDGSVSGPVMMANGKPNPQTFRGVRRLTPNTATMLDSLL